MSGGLSDLSDADLMQMLSAARAGGGSSSGSPPASPPAAPAFGGGVPVGAPGALPIRVRPNNAGSALAGQPAGPDLSGISDDDLMRQLHAARSAAPAAPTRADLDARFQVMARTSRFLPPTRPRRIRLLVVAYGHRPMSSLSARRRRSMPALPSPSARPTRLAQRASERRRGHRIPAWDRERPQLR